jgi:hypothetical protein
MSKAAVLPQLALAVLIFDSTAFAKSVKIHGYVTAVKSPTEFEIDDYRIMRDASLTLEFEKSDDAEEKTTFKPADIRIGTELEIHGEVDESSNQLTAKAIKVHLQDHHRVKRTALIEVQPDLKKIETHWEGQVRADGQRLIVNQSTSVTIKLNNSQKKAAKENAKAAKRQAATKNPEPAVEEDEPGVALTTTDQIKSNTFINYSGTRQNDGSIVLQKAEFTANELTSGEGRLWKSLSPKVKPSNLVTGKPGDLTIKGVGRYKLVPNQEVQKYVSDLGMSLIPANQRGLPAGAPLKIPFQFFVVEQRVPNASALPNGTVVVNSGLLNVLENEAQLAAVLSHEISHATEKHSYRQMQYHKNVRTAIAIAGAVGAAYGGNTGNAVANLTRLTEAAIRNGYQRSLENQADRVGLEYMVAAGYDGREAARVWKAMSLKFGDHKTDFFWSNHDNNTTRRSYLMAELKNNYGTVDFEPSKRNTDQFTSTVNALNTLYSPTGKKVKVKY